MKTKRWIAFLLAICLVFSFAGCSEEEPEETDGALAANQAAADTQGESWAIYWYLCGSDLESEYQAATSDLMEMEQVTLPENVTVVIETGGSYEWSHPAVEAGQLGRYVYTGDTLEMVDALPNANMGAPETLEDFLRFCTENYPADRTMLVFWNHGGGSVSGASFDELYDYDSLTLDEMYEAFTNVWTPSADRQPLELVGFDTCLMATVDVANTFSDIAHYLVASEETEPANGWYYSQWVGALAQKPTMDGAALGKIICDAYYSGCEAVGTQDNTTLSLTDLSKVGPLLDAYEVFGAEALSLACDDPAFFSQFARTAAQSENYGGNR